MKTLPKGIMLQITSWENDADYYNTKTLYGLSECEAKFWLAVAQLCGGRKYSNIYTESSRSYDRIELCHDFCKLANTHHSAIAILEEQYDSVFATIAAFNEVDDTTVDELLNYIGDFAHEVLGSSEFYSFRVYESYVAYFFAEDVPTLELEVPCLSTVRT